MSRDSEVARIAEVLEAAGFEPEGNMCASCGHSGGRHDLGNWCLDCPRPENWDHAAKSPTGAKVAAGWCFFASMTSPEKWSHATLALYDAGLRSTSRDSELREAIEAEWMAYDPILRDIVVTALQEATEAEARAYTVDPPPVVGTWGNRVMEALARHGLRVVRAPTAEEHVPEPPRTP